MSETQHTPGPWTCRRVSVWAFTENGISDKSRIVANTQTAYSDARLIAASPDMLTALEECVTAYEEHRSAQPTGKHWPDPNHILHARAAIAKAKGGE